MKMKKIMSIILSFTIGASLYAGDIANKSNDYLRLCAMLPISNAALETGEIIIKTAQYYKRRNIEDIVLLLSPGDIKVSCKVNDGIIVSIIVSNESKELCAAEFNSCKENIFPLSSQGDWATMISSSLTVVLREINIFNSLVPYLNDNNKSIKLKIKKIAAGKDDLAFELFLIDGSKIKTYYSNEGFVIGKYMANTQEMSFETHKKSILFSDFVKGKAVETSFINQTLITYERIGKTIGNGKKYDKEGKMSLLPPFKFEIIK